MNFEWLDMVVIRNDNKMEVVVIFDDICIYLCTLLPTALQPHKWNAQDIFVITACDGSRAKTHRISILEAL